MIFDYNLLYYITTKGRYISRFNKHAFKPKVKSTPFNFPTNTS